MGMSGSKGSFTRLTGRAKAGLVATAAVAAGFLFGGVATAGANQLTISFDEAQISVLPDVLGPVEANPPEGQSVRVSGSVTPGGAFTAPSSGFVFPDNVIPLPAEDPLLASVLGESVTIKIGARSQFTGSFNSATGSFSTAIPLNLTLAFEAGLNCVLPLDTNFTTSGALVFRGAGEGGQDLTFPAAPFSAPGRAGALYGSWPAVKFSDIKDGPDMPPVEPGERGTCESLLGLLPALLPDWPVGLDGIPGELWLAGKATVPATAPSYSKVALSPKNGKVKRGRSLSLRVSVTNTGGATGTATVALRSSNKQVKVPKSVKITVAAGRTVSRTIKVSASKKAKGKVTVSAKVGSRSASARLTVSR